MAGDSTQRGNGKQKSPAGADERTRDGIGKHAPERVRLDKWLWAARFFKTRSLAAEAIQGGRVHTDGVRAKPSRGVSMGDRIEITRDQTSWEVVIRAVSDKRGPATRAQSLYEETEQSKTRREKVAGEKRAMGLPRPAGSGRPSKRDRRRMEQALRKHLR